MVSMPDCQSVDSGLLSQIGLFIFKIFLVQLVGLDEFYNSKLGKLKCLLYCRNLLTNIKLTKVMLYGNF